VVVSVFVVGPLRRTNDGRIIFWRRGGGDYSGGAGAGLMAAKQNHGDLVLNSMGRSKNADYKPVLFYSNCHRFNQNGIRFGHLLANLCLILKRERDFVDVGLYLLASTRFMI